MGWNGMRMGWSGEDGAVEGARGRFYTNLPRVVVLSAAGVVRMGGWRRLVGFDRGPLGCSWAIESGPVPSPGAMAVAVRAARCGAVRHYGMG